MRRGNACAICPLPRISCLRDSSGESDRWMKEIREILTECKDRRGQPLALATLVRARGSSYRRPGARMLVAHDGKTIGVLSGGCLEEEVAMRAREVLSTGRPLLLSFD